MVLFRYNISLLHSQFPKRDSKLQKDSKYPQACPGEQTPIAREIRVWVSVVFTSS